MVSCLSKSLVTVALASSAWAVMTTKFGKLTDLVTVGDSYSDEGRLLYMIAHGGEGPPAGELLPPDNSTFSGGYIWARLLVNAMSMKLHDYAVGGASCSNDLTPRWFSATNQLFPTVQEYEIPAFLAAEKVSPVPQDTTIYSSWIGVLDLGNAALLTDEHTPGVTLIDITECWYKSIQRLYDNGGRNFVFHNLGPLHLTPLFATEARQGVSVPNHYWPTKNEFQNGNVTSISDWMKTLTVSANMITKLQMPTLAPTWKGAKVAYFDCYQVILDAINNPKQYLDHPYNTTGFDHQCADAECANSYLYAPNDYNGYFWYDELHPSQRIQQLIAEEYEKLLNGQSKYATYYF